MKKIQTQQISHKLNKKTTDVILGGTVGDFKDDSRYTESKSIATVDQETITIKNPITGKEATVVLDRRGTTANKLGAIMLSPDATKDQKNSMLAMYLFEQGKESASFIADLMIFKGTHTKETRAFKSQVRFDFEMFAQKVTGIFLDLANEIKNGIDVTILANTSDEIQKELYCFKDTQENYPAKMIYNIGLRLGQAANIISKQRQAITDARAREKGYGIYINKNGQAYSVFDNELDDVIKKDKEALADALKDNT